MRFRKTEWLTQVHPASKCRDWTANHSHQSPASLLDTPFCLSVAGHPVAMPNDSVPSNTHRCGYIPPLSFHLLWPKLTHAPKNSQQAAYIKGTSTYQ